VFAGSSGLLLEISIALRSQSATSQLKDTGDGIWTAEEIAEQFGELSRA
jgi:hypothetical protein